MSSATPYRIDPPSPNDPAVRRRRRPVRVDGKRPTPVPDDSAPPVSEISPRSSAPSPEQARHRDDDVPARTPPPWHAPTAGADPDGQRLTEEQWLRLHATDLIAGLQAWASELDAREALVATRAAMQKHREREFRVLRQRLMAKLEQRVGSRDRVDGPSPSPPPPSRPIR